ncbi:MAG: permease-like cell division protein FtsX [Candidatus Microsaccharimonas sp.]
MTKKKVASKTLSQQKRHRRQWITFLRMCRYGVNNFTRNAWLTIAATAVMTITLFVIFASVVMQNVMTNTLEAVRDRVAMSVYLKTDTSEQDVAAVVAEVNKLSSVTEVTVQSPEQARDDFIDRNKTDAGTLDAVKEATNMLPWTLSVKVVNINDTTQLAQIVESNEIVKAHIDPNRSPSFAGTRREAIEKIANTASFAQQVGIIISVVFVAISTLIIFNTIRMAIFNRRDEIQMMKLIGAERAFIRGPFIVEASVYGFFAAILASVIGFALFYTAAPALTEADITVAPTMNLLTLYAGFVLLAMIVIGAIIGIGSSLLATRRYLKL